MAGIRRSHKLSNPGYERLIYSGRTVFFRLVDNGDDVDIMTATADDVSDLRAYKYQTALIRVSSGVLADRGYEPQHLTDKQGRPYVMATVSLSEADIMHLAAIILKDIGIEDDISVQAVEELMELHAAITGGSEESTYMMDGMVLTPDGKFTRG